MILTTSTAVAAAVSQNGEAEGEKQIFGARLSQYSMCNYTARNVPHEYNNGLRRSIQVYCNVKQ